MLMIFHGQKVFSSPINKFAKFPIHSHIVPYWGRKSTTKLLIDFYSNTLYSTVMKKYCFQCEGVRNHTSDNICLACGYTSWQLDRKELPERKRNIKSLRLLAIVYFALLVGIFLVILIFTSNK